MDLPVRSLLLTSVLVLCACGASHAPEPLTPLNGASHLLLHDGVLYVSTYAGDLMQLPTDGGAVSVFAAGQPGNVLAADDARLFWGNGYYSQTESRTEVMAAPFAGGAPTQLAPGPAAVGLAIRDGFLYWGSNEQGPDDPTDLGGTLRRVPVNGGAPEVLASGLEVTAVAADSAGVYYADDEDVFNDQVVLLPDGNGAPSVLGTGLSGLGGVVEIVPAGDDLVLVTSTGGGSTSHNLKALPREGGEARVLSLGLDCPVVLGVVAAPPDLYVSCQDLGSRSVERTSLSGGEVEVLATFPEPDGGTTDGPMTNPVLDDTSVYVGAYGTLYRVAR